MGLEELFLRLRENGTEEIVEAHNIDKYHNPQVENGCLKLLSMAADMGFRARRLKWDPAYKGIDDYLLAMKKKQIKNM